MIVEVILHTRQPSKVLRLDIEEFPKYITELVNLFDTTKLLPLNTFNAVLRRGSSSNGMYDYLEWKPFEISNETYRKIESAAKWKP